MLESRDNGVKLPLGSLRSHRSYASNPFDEGTKGRLYFLSPNQRPRAVDAIVGRVEQHSVVFHFVGPAVAPPPIDPQAQCVRLSGSWLWASAIQRSSYPSIDLPAARGCSIATAQLLQTRVISRPQPVLDAMTIHLRKRAVTHRLGRLWIRRTGSKTYDIMFRPTGNGEFRITSEDGLRAFLWGATVPVERIEEAVTALRSDPEYEIPNITLTLERMRKLGL